MMLEATRESGEYRAIIRNRLLWSGEEAVSATFGTYSSPMSDGTSVESQWISVVAKRRHSSAPVSNFVSIFHQE